MDEFVIEWVRGDTVACITAPNVSRLKGRLLKLAEQHPEECDVRINSDGSAVGHVPIRYVRLTVPTKYSDEQKKVMSERMKALLESRRASASEGAKIDSDDADEDFID